MKKVKGQPITGAVPQVSHKRPFVPDAKDTSADEQTFIQEPPTPFKNNMSTAQMPTGSMVQPKPSVGSSPGPGAVGQNRPINQSGQVYGPKGISHPRRVGPQNLGKTRKHARFFGE